MKTKFYELDKIINWNKSRLTILAGRHIIGKSTFLLNIGVNVAEENKSILIFNLETNKKEIEEKIETINNKSLKGKIYINDTPNISINEIVLQAKEETKDKNIDLILIDYIQLIRYNEKNRCLSRDNELIEIALRLKQLSEELEIPIIIISTISKEPQYRENHRPILEDFKNYKNLVQIADVVMFLYREDYYNIETDKKNITEIIVGKNNYGELGTIELLYKYNSFKYVDIGK